jgi:ribonuclease HI
MLPALNFTPSIKLFGFEMAVDLKQLQVKVYGDSKRVKHQLTGWSLFSLSA